MDASLPLQSHGQANLTRRRLLQLAGASGLVVTALGACSKGPAAGQTPTPAPPPPAPANLPPTAAANQPPPPTPTVAASVTPASRVILCRDAWGAQPARPGGTPHTLNRLTIHHTAVALGANSSAPARLRQHQHYHQDTQGWIDIAYHFSVDRNGNIYELRNPGLVGDTATSYDPTGHFLVVCEGNFDEEQVTEDQLNGAALTFAWAAQQFNISTDTLAGHRDASADTACPGAGLYAHVTSGDLKSRIDGLLAVGDIELFPICGPEASSIVAEIEAGSR
ncbi:N-acetylmuramoyl-L-alanine amidase [Mycolicibacterium austroafricanum]|uniref:N-acetylmuramoyl-L-alanine amidase n=1 Tax=Mycolicibacterium austroafricanum TaxID=39687 RepID=UPI000A058C08|nr:N-acetylmuramoyl-L-alanine amidase [Mycolicibacterium austroafricanum]QZY47263.1 N-acetylmuramoyl-L-alanine amidase [Mycolicibacterium austroafricanum]